MVLKVDFIFAFNKLLEFYKCCEIVISFSQQIAIAAIAIKDQIIESLLLKSWLYISYWWGYQNDNHIVTTWHYLDRHMIISMEASY